MNTSKFTFEDWKEGAVPPPPKDVKFGSPDFTQEEIRENEGLWPLYWTYLADSPRMDQNTYQKIKAIQQEYYISAAQINVYARIDLFFDRISGFSSEEKQEYFEIEKELIEERLTDKVLIAKIKRGIFQEYIITPDIHRDIRTTIEWIKKSNKPVVRSCRHGTDTEGWCGNLDRFKLEGDFPTFVNILYRDMLIEKAPSQKDESKNNLENLIKTFAWEVFDPEHDEQMIEDYLKGWERNQGASYPRKFTVDELEKDYPKLPEVYDRSSGGVIGNWEKKWKKFRDSRTEK